MRTPIVVGNWKMNTTPTLASKLGKAAGELATKHSGRVDVGVAPPSIWLERVQQVAGEHLGVFAQSCSEHESGAHTGEISANMIALAQVGGVILGHSERRHVYGETNEAVAAKVSAALDEELSVILCVGEKLEERDAGQTWDVIEAQLDGSIEDGTEPDGIIVAYEPVWAIGTGRTATSAQAQTVHAQIRDWWRTNFGDQAADALRIQYGGSVKPANAAELLSMPDIDGALVGGASLDAESFAAIVAAARG